MFKKFLVWSVVVVVLVAWLVGPEDNTEALEKGFTSNAEMRDAEEEGITDGAAWAAHKSAAAAEEKRQGFHCLSQWDGAHSSLKRAVKDSMRDPDSFEHIETRITPVSDEGTHVLFMEYRAKNGFGGMNIGTARAIIDNDDCGYELVTLE